MIARALAVLACIALCAPANAAQAPSVAAAIPRNQFVPRVVVPQGGTVSFVQADALDRHDLVSLWAGPDRKPLFSTGPGLIDFGQVVDVSGVPALRAGTYPFYCTEHPRMYGQLIVV